MTSVAEQETERPARAGRPRNGRRLARVSAWRLRRRMRGFLRSDEVALVLLAGFVGIVAGLVIAGMVDIAGQLHHVLFAVAGDDVTRSSRERRNAALP